MALGDRLISTDDLRLELNIGDTDDDSKLAEAVDAASGWVRAHCDRDFAKADTATARVFHAVTAGRVLVDDIATTTGLAVAVDLANDGAYATDWASTDYQLEPLNGINAGRTGWPYTSLRGVSGLRFPCASSRAAVQVTAIWGWPAVPAEVKRATTIQAARLYKRRFSPEGVLGGFEGIGAVRVGHKIDPDVAALLAPFRRFPVLVG